MDEIFVLVDVLVDLSECSDPRLADEKSLGRLLNDPLEDAPGSVVKWGSGNDDEVRVVCC